MTEQEQRPFEWHKLIKSKDNGGTQLHAGDLLHPDRRERRIQVRRVHWAKPGFKNITSSGWMVFVDGVEISAAHPRMMDAKRHAELPGVARRIKAMLAGEAEIKW
jgi:hypothetical protein